MSYPARPVRLPDWEARLHAWLDGVAHAPFAYGSHDCALFAAGAVLAMTGDDFGAPFRGRYRSAAGAVRALRLYGAGDLPATLAAALGEAVHPAFAHRGDIVLASGSAGGDIVLSAGSAGVVTGGTAWFVGDNAAGEAGAPGLVRVPRAAWDAAYRVAFPGA